MNVISGVLMQRLLREDAVGAGDPKGRVEHGQYEYAYEQSAEALAAVGSQDIEPS